MTQQTSRELPRPEPRSDDRGAKQAAIVEEANKTNSGDRDLVHADGDNIDLPDEPGDKSKDD
ncbi:hypothetical protein FXV83_22175 [Bradyrhizobium hipponense]|uniref:Uncharacterized protein n=1 Tax=Bradyrhizobium hipponense TaxID=2605638 RepID=A0A5S4YLT7_9BRAD|nr:hypothetical protein [Bradyrhizobium hipponense]TYO64447.1 hypothetical protein FXV83_22175 [Bradyrhizobium hipponense]